MPQSLLENINPLLVPCRSSSSHTLTVLTVVQAVQKHRALGTDSTWENVSFGKAASSYPVGQSRVRLLHSAGNYAVKCPLFCFGMHGRELGTVLSII